MIKDTSYRLFLIHNLSNACFQYFREKEEIEAMQMAERAAMEEAELAVMEVAGLDDMLGGLDDDAENDNHGPEVNIMQL